MTTKTTSNITFGDIITQVSNMDAPDRKFNINGNARIKDNKFTGIDGGAFIKTDGEGNGWFSHNENGNFTFNCNGLGVSDISEAMATIMAFYKEVKETINSKKSISNEDHD